LVGVPDDLSRRRLRLRLVSHRDRPPARIVRELLKTSNANSPPVSSTWLGISLASSSRSYIALLVLDVWLMDATPAAIPPT